MLRFMKPLTDLPSDLRSALGDHEIIVFDGVCVLCSGFYRFVLRHDHAQRFRFVTAQSDLGQALYAALNLPTEDFETNLVITDGQIHERLDAFAAAMAALGWPHRLLAGLRWLPRVIKDPLYHLIARNRYRIFGRADTCLMPTPQTETRFINL